jgi:hypothetical protein
MEAAFPVHRCTSGVFASLLHAYSGGAAPDLHRIPMQHQVPGVIRQVRESSQVADCQVADCQGGPISSGLPETRKDRNRPEMFRGRRSPHGETAFHHFAPSSSIRRNHDIHDKRKSVRQLRAQRFFFRIHAAQRHMEERKPTQMESFG